MRPLRTECRAQPAGHACGPPLREAAARTAQRAATTTKSFARAGCEGRSCGREPAPAQGRMSIHWSQAPRQAGMYSRRSDRGAGGSLNLPDRTGTSAFLNRAQHQVNRILCPNKKTSLKGTVVPATPGRKDCPIARSVPAPGHGPQRCGQAKAEIFQICLCANPPHPSILPSARRLAGMQDYFRTSVCALSKAGFYNRPASQPTEHARQTG